MSDDLVQFAFVGCVVCSGAAMVFACMYLLSPEFRKEVKDDFNRS